MEDGALECAVKGGAASPEYTKLCAWIVSELKLYCKLEENVHATNSKTLRNRAETTHKWQYSVADAHRNDSSSDKMHSENKKSS